MITLDVHLDGDGVWQDLAVLPPERLINGMDATALALAVLPHGTARGRPSVAIRIDLPDGRVVVTQTSMALLAAAMRAITDRYGEDRDHGR